MKNSLLTITVFSLLLSALSCPVPAHAQPAEQSILMESFPLENGDCLMIELTAASPASLMPLSAAHTISGNKKITYQNSDGEALWSFTLSASFSYNGNRAECTSADTSSSVFSSNWKLTDISKSKSGNTATASVTAHQYLLGINIKTVTETLHLSCSKDGKLS